MRTRYVITVDKYEDGSVSCWYLPLTEAEETEYDEFMDKHSSAGWSARGDADSVLDELKEVLTDLQPWA